MSDVLESLTDEEREKVVSEDQPDWMDPMLAKLTHDHFDNPDWFFERKLDGQRCLVFKKDGEVKLYSRNQNTQNEKFPELVEALSGATTTDFIADGEIVVMNEGVSSFSDLQPRIHSKSPDPSVPVKMYLFDLMHYNQMNLTALSNRTRKSILRSELSFEEPLRYTPHRNESGLSYLEEACSKQWEGLIAKDAAAAYHHGRSSKWLKFKCHNQQEFVIGGFTEPQGEREGFGALLVGVQDDEGLRFCGRVGTGYDNDFLVRFRKELNDLKRKTSPFHSFEDSSDEVHWVTPEKVCEVSFTEWTSDHKLRHPSFLGLRADKSPEDVRREG